MEADYEAGALLSRVFSCRECARYLPNQPRPVVSWSPQARIVIIGQAPGRRVHERGIPWCDPSGKLLREWLGVADSEFYDDRIFALIPMGFCYPGKGKSGDLPPRPECAPLWHDLLLSGLRQARLKILVGRHSQNYYLGESGHGSLTENVRHFRGFLPDIFPLPHPSPRNRAWFSANPWFDRELLPVLREYTMRIVRA